MTKITIGTCGYSRFEPGEGWKEEYETKLQAYTDAFEVLELNRTFYELPQVSTAERWRENAIDEFEFVVKAWQALTHPTSMPTWNSHRDGLTEEQEECFGLLRTNDATLDAWEKTRAIAEALDANVVLVQCPGSFGPSDENVANVRGFFETIDRGEMAIAWEPRGDWKSDDELVSDLCGELDLVHVVDPCRESPVDDGNFAYLRLHGLNDDPYDYDYDYTDEELDDLASVVGEVGEGRDRVYCMFNNHHKFENARSLEQRL